jgi:hypothetical protein
MNVEHVRESRFEVCSLREIEIWFPMGYCCIVPIIDVGHRCITNTVSPTRCFVDASGLDACSGGSS